VAFYQNDVVISQETRNVGQSLTWWEPSTIKKVQFPSSKVTWPILKCISIHKTCSGDLEVGQRLRL